jgi:hypothetical protein
MMMMKIRIKRPSKLALIMLSLIAVILISFIVPVTVSYADSMDNMIPSDSNKDAIYNTYKPSHYSFQSLLPDRKFWEVGAKTSDGVTVVYDHVLSMVFLANVQITRFFNFVAREAFEFTFMNSLIDGVAQIIQSVTGIDSGNIGGGLWNSMFGIFASVTLVYVLWQVVRFKFLDSFQTMVSFVLALVVAFAFFANAGTFLRFINDAGNELAATMYSGLAKPGGLSSSTTTGVQAISEQVWMEVVLKPYSMLQFDDPTAYDKHPDLLGKVLKTDPYSSEREKALKDVIGTFPAVEKIRIDEQMIILVCNSIFAGLLLGLLCFWAVATIYIRLKLLVHATIMSITLLASLLPGREAGLSVIRTQFVKLIGLVLMTTFTMFFLDLSLVLGHMTFNLVFPKAGWFTGMMLEVLVVFVIFKYRQEIGSVFSKAAGNIPLAQKTKSTMVDAMQRNITRSVYNKAGASISGMFNRKEPEGVPSTFNPSSITNANGNMNDATTASMQLRYQREKDASEQLSSETGQPAQYTPYVQKVNENLKNGTKNPFRGMDKEWKEEKSRLSDVKNDGGDVRQAILSQGVNHDMNDQQVAATMYANENSIRQASTFMVNRPKSAVNQIQRAGTLNKNRKLETSVNDFVMIELFERYKVEYKQAIDTSAATGEPIKHSDFVKGMDDRFKSSGMNTTQKVNETMLSRGGRISSSSKFESMPEFRQKKDDLLHANEAFLKATTPVVGVAAPVAPVSLPVLANPASVLKSMPSIPTASTTVAIPFLLSAVPNVKMDLDLSKVKVPDNIKQSMNEAKAKLADSSALDIGDRVEINTTSKTEVFTTLKQRVSHQVSTDLNGLSNELKVMQKANGNKLAEASVNASTDNVVKKNTQTAQQTRKPKTRPSAQ